MRAERGSSPMMASEVTLLPEPDSPTIPSTCPGWRSKLTPRTAWTMPSSVGNSTVRSLTWRTGSPSVRGGGRSGGGGGLRAVADEVDGQGDDHDDQAGEVEQPRTGGGRLLAGRDQQAERGVRGSDAEAQVGERGLEQDGHGHGHGGVDDDRPGGVRQEVPEHDPGVAGPQRPRRLHELLL